MALGAAILLVELPASAATMIWIGGSGQWDVADNWSPSGQPQAGDDVNLMQSSATSRTVTYYNTTNPTAVLNSLKIDATGAGTMTLDMPNNHALSVTSEYVGYSGKGAVTQSAGTDNVAMLYLGYNATGDGTYTLAGGTLSGSSVQYIGYSGKGTLSIQSGGQVSSASTAYLGYNAGASGAATVTGAGSIWTSSNTICVGMNGSGALNIEAGGQVRSAYCNVSVGTGSTGTATVTGTGSKWTNSGTIYVGSLGAGSLNVLAGGQVSSGSLRVGSYGGGTQRR
jgi:T5SS/PEP-CTERM-associated repeat protein